MAFCTMFERLTRSFGAAKRVLRRKSTGLKTDGATASNNLCTTSTDTWLSRFTCSKIQILSVLAHKKKVFNFYHLHCRGSLQNNLVPVVLPTSAVRGLWSASIISSTCLHFLCDTDAAQWWTSPAPRILNKSSWRICLEEINSLMN